MKRILIIGLLGTLAAPPAFAGQRLDETGIDPVVFRNSIASVRFDGAPARETHTATPPAVQGEKKMSKGWRALWTAAAGFGGFYAGGVIGARIEGGCNGCDDPGLKGAIIGAPIGAATAAIATWIISGK